MRTASVIGSALSVALIIASAIVVPLSAFIAEGGCTLDDPCSATSDPVVLLILAVGAFLGAIASLPLSLRGLTRYAGAALGLTFLALAAWGWILYRAMNDSTF